MENKKWQARIRKELTEEQRVEVFGEELASLGVATQVRTITSNDEIRLIEFLGKIDKALPDWEVISVIMVDTDNSDLLGEDFDWDEVA
jgi:hypothetical protein